MHHPTNLLHLKVAQHNHPQQINFHIGHNGCRFVEFAFRHIIPSIPFLCEPDHAYDRHYVAVSPVAARLWTQGGDVFAASAQHFTPS